MSSQKMNLLDMPIEIFKAILVIAARVRGFTRALRLRLVSKFFSDELVDALCASGLMDECEVPLGKWRYVRPYVEKRLLERRTENLPTLHAIRRIADILASEDGTEFKYEDIALQLLQRASTVRGLYVCHLLGSIKYCEEGFNYDVLTASVAMNDMYMVKRLINTEPKKSPGHIFDQRSGIFGQPTAVAVETGNYDALSILLATPAQQPLLNFSFIIRLLSKAVSMGNLTMFNYLLTSSHLQTFNRKSEASKRRLSVSGTAFSLHTSSVEIFETALAELKTHTWFCEDDSWVLRLLRCTIGHGWIDMTRHLLTWKEHAPASTLSLTGTPLDLLLNRASSHGEVEILKMLLDHGAKICHNELRTAASRGHTSIIRMLLENGADVNSTLARNCLYEAARRGSLDIVRLLLDSGMDPNTGDTAPLIGALESEYVEIFQLLVERGGDVARIIPEARRRAEASGLDSMVELLGKYDAQ